MKITIHKGTDEIGGSCVELSTDTTTILLDYGTPLKEDSIQVEITKPVNAILISHPHQDHFGEIINIDLDTPIYCGKLSLELMNATKIFTGGELLQNNFHIFEAWKSFSIGDFKITPYLVDHSATDAYAFLIEADDKRVLYSGDFRANGRKSKLFDKMIEDENLKNIDVLLMEGTMLQRNNDGFPDEQSVEDAIYKTISKNNLIGFMIGSSQNIDSIVSAYKASKKAEKIFVVDIYTAWILEKIKIVSNSVPNIFWSDVKVIRNFGGNYYNKIKDNTEYFGNFKYNLFKKENVIDLDTIKENPSKYLLKVSPWHIKRFIDTLGLDDANIIYSQWLGYLKEDYSDIKSVLMFQKLKEDYNWIYAHTSGHADIDVLKLFASSLSPKKLIPIHTEHKEEFSEHFENVAIMSDNESYDINSDKLTTYQVQMLNETFKNEFGE